MPSDPSLTAEQEAEDDRIEAEVLRRLQARAAAEAEARGNPEAALPSWYPAPAPTDEDLFHRTFPRGTTTSEVLEFDRQQAEARLAAEGRTRPPAPLPQGSVTATASEFSA